MKTAEAFGGFSGFSYGSPGRARTYNPSVNSPAFTFIHLETASVSCGCSYVFICVDIGIYVLYNVHIEVIL